METLLPILFALQAVGPVPAAVPPAAIADNSFIIEEAYNQEPGVVQHINVFQRDAARGGWLYAFTQEWPLLSQRQQLSYTLAALGTDHAGSGFGDAAINWRYQVVSNQRIAVAPRVSLTFPTGDSDRGHGAGGTGVQFNLPVSVLASPSLALHSNIGAAIVPRGRDDAGDVSSVTTFWLGQSAVWPVQKRIQVLVEALWTHDDALVFNPGLRWAHDFAGGLQIVPGVSIPLTRPVDAGTAWAVLGYVSFEHPFGRRR